MAGKVASVLGSILVLSLLAAHVAEAAYPAYCSGNVEAQIPLPPSDYKLEFVGVMTRHGDRLPIHDLPGQEMNWMCGMTDVSKPDYISTRPKLRGGHPSNAGLFRKAYTDRRCIPGQLTEKGSEQHITLGTGMRTRYVDQLHFLKPVFDPEEVRVRSTDVWRTQQSAQSFIKGMYDGFIDDVVDIHTAFAPEEVIDYGGYCPRLNQLMAERKQSDEWARRSAPYDKVKTELCDIMGMPTSDFAWNDVADFTYATLCHQRPLPCFSTKKCLTMDLVNKAMELNDFMFTDVRQFSEEVSRLNMGPFLKMLQTSIQDRLTGRSKTKFALYSAHDSSIAPLLGALGIDNDTIPPYASHVRFEVFSAATGERYVQVSFNGHVAKLRNCATPMCTMVEFQRLVQRMAPKDLKAECVAH